MRIASTDGAGWTVEIVELTLTRRRTARRRTPGGSPAPLGDGGRSRIPASQDGTPSPGHQPRAQGLAHVWLKQTLAAKDASVILVDRVLPGRARWI
jgi:hypothetical protein